MPDYGRPLSFGTFITPTNRQPELPVALATLSEELGYELVTFQDHPYQPAFLDTWTLLSFVAARTERIRLSGNVLNLPLRPPAVLARAAASLDLLSGGRFELGLGAGGFWDPIAAMGGPRLTAGESVDALEEAIGVIRAIWAEDERAPLRLEGEHYRLDGAKRGPRPAHEVPIWLGALKPRMLRLIGRRADGWLPSMPYLQPGDLRRGNAIIDEAAREAGREPREIERLLNVGSFDGPADGWVEQLVPLALEDGVSTFIVMGDDPRTLQTFAEEVAPAVREAVAKARESQGTAAGPVRAAAALARRRDGIDYDGLPPELAATAVEPGDFEYSRVRSTYMRGGAPGLVLRPRDVPEVVQALAFARDQEVPFAVRSGGHGISGRSTNDGGVIVDVGALDAVEVLDEATRRIRVGPGARWAEVARALEPHGWALSSGDYGGVGVGGLATAGGIGWLARSHGLTIDHLVAAEVVLADGSVVRTDEREHPDLFWAIRGAGANFGIVTSFEFVVDEVAEIGFGQLAFDASDVGGFFERWGAAVEASPRDTTAFVLTGRPRPGQPVVAQAMVAVESDDPDTVLARLQALAEVAPLLGSQASMTTYAAVMSNDSPDPHQGQGEPVSRSGLVTHITRELGEAIERLLASGVVYFFQIRAIGGAVADVPADATAFAGRDANFSLVAFGSDRASLDAAWEDLHAHVSGLYLSFETDGRPERLADAFPPAHLARLRTLKHRYDPDNAFRDNFNVAPSPAVG